MKAHLVEKEFKLQQSEEVDSHLLHLSRSLSWKKITETVSNCKEFILSENKNVLLALYKKLRIISIKS